MEKVSIEDRARKYIGKMPPAVAGSGGHDATFRVACVLVVEFSLPQAEALVLLREWNQRCDPPWSEKELERKIDQAGKEIEKQPSRVGKLLNAGDRDGAVPFSAKKSGRRPTDHRSTQLAPSHDSRDLPLLAGGSRRIACGVGCSVEISADDLSPEVDLHADEPKTVEKPAELNPYCAAYGSKRAMWGHVKALMVDNMSRWIEGTEMRAPNVLRVDPAVHAVMPDVVDGMIVRPGPKGKLALESDPTWSISGGKAVRVNQEEE